MIFVLLATHLGALQGLTQKWTGDTKDGADVLMDVMGKTLKQTHLTILPEM